MRKNKQAGGRGEIIFFLTFQADKEDSPQESQATPSKSRAHSSDELDAITLVAQVLRGRDWMRSLAVRVGWPAK